MTTRTDILLIEDEPNIAEAIRFILSRDGWQVVHLAEGLYKSKEKINPNYFYSSLNTNSSLVYYTGMEKAFRFKELKPDSKGHLPSHMADLIAWLEAKERVLEILHRPHRNIKTADSLL